MTLNSDTKKKFFLHSNNDQNRVLVTTNKKLCLCIHVLVFVVVSALETIGTKKNICRYKKKKLNKTRKCLENLFLYAT